MLLKSLGRPLFNVRLGRRQFICLRSSSMDEHLRELIRPFALGGLSCWVEYHSN